MLTRWAIGGTARVPGGQEILRRGAAAGFQFPAAGVQLEFHVGVTKAGEGKAGVKFYVVELGASGGYAREEIQAVRDIW
jgi:hypothetical protein